MQKNISYRILMMGLRVGLSFALSAAVANAQQPEQERKAYNPTTPTQDDMYCSSVITDQPVPKDTYVISGENSSYKNTFQPGDYIFINRGGDQGVKVGDEFEVARAERDPMGQNQWFKYQKMLSHAMGTKYRDVGRLRVIHVAPKLSTVVIDLFCGAIQRGDLVRPFVERPAPVYRKSNLDPFAPPSGKKTAMIVFGTTYGSLTGPGRIVYINLGSGQGVQVGDYFRMFRYQGSSNETVFSLKDTAYKVYGYGSTPVAYMWNDLPRQVLGEGIVLRTGPNSSTVMVRDVRQEIFAGDYVELE